MPLDAQLAPLMGIIDKAPRLSTHTLERARQLHHQLFVGSAAAGPKVEVGSVEEIEVAGGDGPIGARLYRPAADGPMPTLVYFHGGGFVIGDMDTSDTQCRLLCRDAGVVVLSVDYRLAPEAPFPAAHEDALAAFGWAVEHVDELGGIEGRIATGGESAGGNLAAVLTQDRRGEQPPIAAQLLIYPVTDMSQPRPSTFEHASGGLLTIEDMIWFNSQYLTDPATATDPRCSPLLAEDKSGLPPAIVATAEYDPLRDDGNAYAASLEEAGVSVTHHCFEGLPHSFFGLGAISESAAAAIAEVCSDVRRVLS